MAPKSVFFSHALHCPMCSTKGVMRRPNPNLYSVTEKEDDEHPLEHSWKLEGFEHIVPHHYAVWQCPTCLYADFVESMVPPSGHDYKLFNIKRALKTVSVEREQAVERLAKLVGPEELTGAGSAALHVSALLIALLPGEKGSDPSRVGRLALRLAWILRESESGKIPNDAEWAELTACALAMSGDDDDVVIPTREVDALRLAAKAFARAYTTDDKFDEFSAALEMSGIIGTIYQRLQDYPQAAKFVSAQYNRAFSYKKSVETQMARLKKSKELHPSDERLFVAQIQSAGTGMGRATASRRQIFAALTNVMKPRVKGVLAQTRGKAVAEREEALAAAGIPVQLTALLKACGFLND